jgi:hypothetical protein
MVTMRLLDRFLIRRRALPRFSALPANVRRRLALACREVTKAEAEMAQQLALPAPPRLLMVDEESAVIVLASDRDEIS